MNFCHLLIFSGQHIQLQKTLLSPEQRDLKPDQQFLELFSADHEVGSKWPSLASSLSLTSSEVEEVKKRKQCSHQEHALQVLKKWVEREDATYGQLCLKLKAIPLFQHCRE